MYLAALFYLMAEATSAVTYRVSLSLDSPSCAFWTTISTKYVIKALGRGKLQSIVLTIESGRYETKFAMQHPVADPVSCDAGLTRYEEGKTQPSSHSTQCPQTGR
jgi:hypothetical protein